MTAEIDHKAFLASLPAARRNALIKRSNRHGLVHLALFWGLMLGLGILVYFRVPGWPLLMLPLGICIIFNFTLAHECTHQTPFKSRPINELVGHISGALVFVPFLWFRAFHLAHHRHTNDPMRDPEIKDAPRPEGWSDYLWHLLGLTTWWGQLSGTLGRAFGRIDCSYVAKSARVKILVEAIIHVCFYMLIVFSSLKLSTEILILWIIPAFLGQPFLRLYLLAEHGRCPEVVNMFENTRTVFTTRVVRFLAWNMPYHVEHHTFPQVPFYLLPEFHEDVQAHLKVTSEGYPAFHRAYIQGFEAG